MKKALIILLFGALIFNACQPVYDKAPDIGTPPTVKIQIAEQIDPNHIVLTVETDNGSSFYWDFGNGYTSTNMTDTAYYPFAGTYTVKVIVNGKGGTTLDSMDLEITQNDPNVANAPGIKELTNTGAGRTWVFAFDNTNPSDSAFFYMTAAYNWDEFWWNPVPDNCCDTRLIMYDSIRFDLEGNYNFTHYCYDGTVEKGTFIYDDANKTIKFINANLPYHKLNTGLLNPDALNSAIYMVKVLDDSQLWLWQDQSISGDYSYGWMWVFKPAGTTFPSK